MPADPAIRAALEMAAMGAANARGLRWPDIAPCRHEDLRDEAAAAIAAFLRALPDKARMMDTPLCPASVGGFQFRALAVAVEEAARNGR